MEIPLFPEVNLHNMNRSRLRIIHFLISLSYTVAIVVESLEDF